MHDVIRLELPRGPTREYLRCFGVAAVYVAVLPAGTPAIIGVSRDLASTDAWWRRESPVEIEIVAAYWTRSDALADKLAAAVREQLADRLTPDGRYRVTGEAACREVERTAGLLGVTVTDHGVAMRRATEAADRLFAVLEQANREGTMRAFNSAFRSYRETCDARGVAAMTFPQARARLRNVLVKRIAEGSVVSVTPEVVAEVFEHHIKGVV